MRTIASLLVSNIDPNICGFLVDSSSFEVMRFMLEAKLLPKKLIDVWWKPIQEAIPEHVQHDLCGSRSFFEWFQKTRLDSYASADVSVLYHLYGIFPYWFSKACRKAFDVLQPKLKYYEPIKRIARMRKRPCENVEI
jgi:hypothetical protein